ncbi:hypothetical protein CEXT_701171 [Caerostris extrusa]|uniref:Uncharacterized protein n=1 Tax=Caerostris extrusa TaxID=172846 RepID=A0AAV4NU90_CAEEX|nr:hypothetical protein CEXT_701171 [Caerostris extrusa]
MDPTSRSSFSFVRFPGETYQERALYGRGKRLHPPIMGRYLTRERSHVRVTSAIALGSYFGPFPSIIRKAVAAGRYRCSSCYGSNLPLFFHLSDSQGETYQESNWSNLTATHYFE